MMAAPNVLRRRVFAMTMVELTIAITIFMIIAMAVYQGTIQGVRQFSSDETSLRLEDQGRNALDRIVSELRGSGIAENPAAPGNPTLAYPYIWTGNTPPFPYDGLALAPADLPQTFTTEPADPAANASSSIVFVVPVSDGTTVVDPVSGESLPLRWSPGPPPTAGAELVVEWGARQPGGATETSGNSFQQVAYQLVLAPTGDFNRLERRVVPNGQTEVICNYVERVVFSYYATGAVQDRNQIRVDLYLRKQDERGLWMRADLSAGVAMRSTEPSD